MSRDRAAGLRTRISAQRARPVASRSLPCLAARRSCAAYRTARCIDTRAHWPATISLRQCPRRSQHRAQRRFLARNPQPLATRQYQLRHEIAGFQPLWFCLHQCETYGRRFSPQSLPPCIETVFPDAVLLAIGAYRLPAHFLRRDPLTPPLPHFLLLRHAPTMRVCTSPRQWGSCDAYTFLAVGVFAVADARHFNMLAKIAVYQ